MNSSSQQTGANPTPTRPFISPAPLWASAAVIAAMIVLQAAKVVPGPAAARADMVAKIEGFTALTTASGGSEELLYLLDERDERLLVYRVENNRRVALLASVDVPQMFTDAANNAR